MIAQTSCGMNEPDSSVDEPLDRAIRWTPYAGRRARGAARLWEPELPAGD